MALFIRQDEGRSELQKRLATELQDKARERAKLTDLPDGVADSQYIKGTKSTTSLAWAWILIVALIVGISLWLIVISMAR
jgi:uncharacterized protein HemX